jgi:hypothetical protein
MLNTMRLSAVDMRTEGAKRVQAYIEQALVLSTSQRGQYESILGLQPPKISFQKMAPYKLKAADTTVTKLFQENRKLKNHIAERAGMSMADALGPRRSTRAAPPPRRRSLPLPGHRKSITAALLCVP